MDKNLVDLFRKLARKHSAVVQDYLKGFNIYLGQHRIFFTLEKQPNITFTELADILKVSKESLSVSIKRLDQAGFIHKEVDKNDKRRSLLRLNEKGLETSKACKEGFDTINHSMFKNLCDEEKENLSVLFEKMIDGLEDEENEEVI